MAVINLEKGGRISLNKGVSKFRVGLAWDASAVPGKEFDLDASALVLNAAGKMLTEKHFVYYNNLSDPEGAVVSAGDNRTGAGDGDDETISIDFSKINPAAESVLILLNIHEGIQRGQNFGQVKNSKASLYEGDSATPVAKYDLEEDASMSTQVRFIKFYKKDGEWKFQALGEANKKTLHDMLQEFGLDSQPNI